MVSFFFRASRAGAFSIEALFDTILTHLPQNIPWQKCFVPYAGIKPKALAENVIYSQKQGTSVNHITGDVHYVAIGLPKSRTILTIHDLRPLERGSLLKRRLIKWWWFSLPVKRVRYVTVISEATKQELLKHVKVNPEKVIVIPNCLSSAFSFMPKAFNRECPRILHLGTKENKNLERLIPALKGLSCHLRIIGKLSMEQKALLEQNQITYSNVYSLSSEEVVKEYSQADIVSFVSLYEGFGMPIIEAQATGRPVITSNCSSMPEVGGEAALYVDPYSIEEIRSGILRLINEPDLREALIQRGLENVKRFSAREVAAQYAALYHKVAEENA